MFLFGLARRKQRPIDMMLEIGGYIAVRHNFSANRGCCGSVPNVGAVVASNSACRRLEMTFCMHRGLDKGSRGDVFRDVSSGQKVGAHVHFGGEVQIA